MEENVNYIRIEKAIKYLVANVKKQPSLDELAAYIGLSPHHFQRIFSEWAGVSPKKFLEYLTVDALKQELLATNNLIDAAENTGLSSPSRVYDLFIHIEAVTPGEYKTKGRNLLIEYGSGATPFGECCIAVTGRGICALQFGDNNKEQILSGWKEEWENASFIENNALAEKEIGKLFLAGKEKSFHLLLRGTPFQLKVWEALLKIPFGAVVSYNSLARLVGSQDATRAVASAVARNPVGYLIPCHRVIRNEGVVGQYHWSPARKAALIGWERSRRNS